MEITGYRRSDGGVGARNHMLVLPSVICATRVAGQIAEAVGGMSIIHQHGCSQVGDDAVRTGDVFDGLAVNPNVGAVLVVGLGCETLQGRELANRIAARGQRIAFVGIQEAGGSNRALDEGRSIATAVVTELALVDPEPDSAERLVVGIEASRSSAVVGGLVERIAAVGGKALTADRAPGPYVTVVPDAGRAEQQHVAFAAGGAQIIVSFPDPDAAPVGFPICPVLSVASDSSLHQAIADDFDIDEAAGADALWARLLAVQRGALTACERSGTVAFALERLTMTM